MIVTLVGVIWLDQRLGSIEFTAQYKTAPGLPMLVLMLLLIVLGTKEIAAMFGHKGLNTNAFVPAMGSVLICVAAFHRSIIAQHNIDLSALIATIGAVTAMAALIRHSVPAKQTDGALGAAAACLFCVGYLGVLPMFYVLIRMEYSAYVIAGLIMTTKSCDIGAYFTGRMVGKTKLIEWLSPKKTREGLAGGLVFSAVVATGLAWLSNRYDLASATSGGDALEFNLVWAAVGGALLGGVGHIGDLVASLFKRDAGIKDSGNVIPGFGGVIDVVDSPLFVAPLAYWMLI